MESNSSSSSESVSWISNFCCEKGNEYFCQVDADFITDSFNLTGLQNQVFHFSDALNVVLGLDLNIYLENRRKKLSQSARFLYGLIHSRYILTLSGLHRMKAKYLNGDFGTCPRFYCDQQTVLPIALSDKPNSNLVKLYCPRCLEVYKPVRFRHRHIDGAFFGTSFPHLFFMTFPEQRPPAPIGNYTAELFGFNIHPSFYND